MRKLRLSLALPVIQFVIALALLEWGYRTPVPRGSELYVPTGRLIFRGLNAPALIFRFLNPIRWGPTFDSVPRSMFGFDTDDLFILLGVIVVWYCVGRALDQQRTSTTAKRTGVATVLVTCLLLLALGGLLFLTGLHDLGPGRANNPALAVGAFLTLIWSVTLFFLSGRGVVQAIRFVARGSSG